jgi:ring-1,2-phenylacetyl-CoA epoxidase subunit PaaA
LPSARDELVERIRSGFVVESVDDMTEEYLKALRQTLIIVADTELMSAPLLGWGPRFAPTVNAQISSMAIVQDEIGHAHLAMRLLEDLGVDTEWLVYDRPADQWKAPYHFGIRLRSWTEFVVANLCMDRAGFILLGDVYRNTSYGPWKRALAKVDREEVFHIRHGEVWVRRLASDPAARAEIQRVVDWMFPLCCEQFGLPDPMKTRGVQLEFRLRGKSNDQLRQEYIASLKGVADQVGLRLPVHWDDGAGRWAFDGPFPAHFDPERRVYDWSRAVSWEQVRARWGQMGPDAREFVDELQRGARQYRALRRAG